MGLAAKYPLPDAKYTRRQATDTLVIHCAATDEQDFSAADIRRWHVLENGWLDIGYHYVIRRNGDVELGRPKWAVGAHVAGHNATSIGICMVGGGSTKECNNFTGAQWGALRAIVRNRLVEYPITKVCGHRDFPDVHKWCPSFSVAAWLEQNPDIAVMIRRK